VDDGTDCDRLMHALIGVFRRLDGGEFVMDASVHSWADDGHARLAIGAFVTGEDSRLPLARAMEPGDALVLGTVDSDWRVDRVSADVEELLGLGAAEIVAQSLSTLVSPSDWPALLIGVGHGLTASGGASLRLRLRTADGSWRHCRMLITGLAGGVPESLGFAFAITDPSSRQADDRARELENLIHRIAREIAATGVTAGLFRTPAVGRLPAMAGLSRRELEIVTALLSGDRAKMIAQRLFLSESTVRNHLTAVYRKLGVRSQQQLLTLLRQD